MNYSNIFPLTLEGAAPLYPILTSIFGSLLFAALFEFGYSRIVERLYGETLGWKFIYRVQIYLFLINLPYIFLILQGTIYNTSLLPLEVALKIDQIYILIICGYICYLEESRQTPIRGFVVIKDSLFILLNLGLLSSIYEHGTVSSQEIFTILPVYFVGLIVQIFTNEIEQCLLLALRIKEKNIYRASFLLTEKSQPSNFLEIKDIIASHEDQIQEEIDDFISIATRLRKSNEELTILANFAKIFIPIKKAYEINEQASGKEIHEQFVQSWDKIEYDYLYQRQREGDDDTEKVYSFNNSASTLIIKKTFTTDSFLEGEDLEKQAEESLGYKVIKYLYYPLYLSTEITGRVRYFMDYLIVILMIGCIFLLSNAIAYFSVFFPQQQNLISLAYAGLLFYPIARYFIRISQGTNDYDFLGIFMEGMIIKIGIFAISLAILSILNSNSLIESGESTLLSLLVRIATFAAYCAFLSWKRFAMRYNNLRVFVILFTVSQVVRILGEYLMDYLA